MQNQTDSTFLQFAILPSDPTNHYHSVRGESFIEARTESDFKEFEVTSAFSVANNGSVTTLRFDGYAFHDAENPEEGTDVETIEKSLADLEVVNEQWQAFYAATKSALEEARHG